MRTPSFRWVPMQTGALHRAPIRISTINRCNRTSPGQVYHQCKSELQISFGLQHVNHDSP